MRMDKLVIVLVATFVVFATVSVLDTVSATSSKNIDKNIVKNGVVIDSGSAPLKDNENVTLNFKVIAFKNNKVVVYQKFSGLIGGNTKTIIQKSKKNELKITTIYLTGTPGNKEVAYVSSKYLPKKYYWKVFRLKMLEKVASGGAIYNHDANFNVFNSTLGKSPSK